MKVRKTLPATVFYCEDCDQEFKGTDEDRKKCAMCDNRNIIKRGGSTITTDVEVDHDYEEDLN